MTVCIAAICQHKGQDAIVLCCDWQGTMGQMIKAENTDKIISVGPMSALLSGVSEDAKELARKCERAMKELAKNLIQTQPQDFEITVDTFLSTLRKVADEQKVEMVRRYLMQKYALRPEQFWEHAKATGRYQMMAEEVGYVGLGGSLILCAAPEDHEAIIVQLDNQSGRVAWKNEFATIGSGALMASSVLNQYDFGVDVPLMKCLRRVYAAKVAAECDLYVGKDTSLEILWKGRRFILSDQAFKLLDNSVRSVREPSIPFKPKYLEEMYDEEAEE